MERIIRDEAAPDQTPERFDRLARIACAGGLVKWIEEACTGGLENGKEFFFSLRERINDGPLLCEEGQLVREEESDAAIALANGLDAGPGNFAGGN